MKTIKIEQYYMSFFIGVDSSDKDTYLRINSNELINLENFDVIKKKNFSLKDIGRRIYDDAIKGRVGLIKSNFKMNKGSEEEYLGFLVKINERFEGIDGYNVGCPLDLNTRYHLEILRESKDKAYLQINETEAIDLKKLKIINYKEEGYLEPIEYLNMRKEEKEGLVRLINHFTLKTEDKEYLEDVISKYERMERKERRDDIFKKIYKKINKTKNILYINKNTLDTRDLTIRMISITSILFNKEEIKVTAGGFQYNFEGNRAFFEKLKKEVFREEKEEL